MDPDLISNKIRPRLANKPLSLEMSIWILIWGVIMGTEGEVCKWRREGWRVVAGEIRKGSFQTGRNTAAWREYREVHESFTELETLEEVKPHCKSVKLKTGY